MMLDPAFLVPFMTLVVCMGVGYILITRFGL